MRFHAPRPTLSEALLRGAFNLAIGMEGRGEIPDDGQGKIITYTNDALLRLYTRFVLSEKDLLVELISGRTNYHMLPEFTESNCDADACYPRYIKDAADPFQDDLLKILRVVDECGCDLPLNDEENICSVFTPKFNMLQVPSPSDGQTISVVYQAKHPELEYGPRGQEIILPATLEKALTSYIAAEVFGSMGGAENSAKSQEHMARFESICAEVTDRDAVSNTVSTSNTKFDKRGFV